uniref:Uncharacterized protein n=1 Tax=Anguilla anguilla TaxID=7936 RepID=A0A0E9S701_ANGAN
MQYEIAALGKALPGSNSPSFPAYSGGTPIHSKQEII